MIEMDNTTISCSHLMVELSVLAGQKLILKGVVITPFGRRGLNQKIHLIENKSNRVPISKYPTSVNNSEMSIS